MLADPLTYFWLLIEHWPAFMTGGVTVAVFLLLERINGRSFKLRTFVTVFIIFGFVAASYQTWHDQYAQQSARVALRTKHVDELQQFWVSGGIIVNEKLPKDTSKEDFDKWIAKADAWANNTATWIGDNLGVPARERFLDTTGTTAGFYSLSINPEHNSAVQHLIRLRENLRDLIENDTWDNAK